MRDHDHDVKIYDTYDPRKRRLSRRFNNLKKYCKNIKLNKKLKSMLSSVNSRKEYSSLVRKCKSKSK